MSETRFYGFGNYYLSSIQQGIQSAHVLGELFVKYNQPDSIEQKILYDWAKNHKTMVLLNGGNSASLKELHNFFNEVASERYPFASFNEDEQSLDCALTCVGIILPEKIYSLMGKMRAREEIEVSEYDEHDYAIAEKLFCFSLAH